MKHVESQVKGGSPLTVAGMLDRKDPSLVGNFSALQDALLGLRCFVPPLATEDLCLWC